MAATASSGGTHGWASDTWAGRRTVARASPRRATAHLGAAARALSSAGSVSSVMRALVEALTPDLCDACEVALVDADGTLRRVASGPGRAAAREAAPIPDIAWHPLRLALAGEVQVLDAADPAHAAAFGPQEEPLSARALGARRAIVVPMCGRSTVVGVLATAMGPSDRPWGRGDLELVTTIADLGGLAIETLRALQHHRRVVHRLQRAATVGSALSAVDGVEGIAEVLVSVARDELGASTGLVYLRDGDVLRLAAAAGY